MKIREIRAAGLTGATPEGGWSNELEPDDCVHTLVVVLTDVYVAREEPEPGENVQLTIDLEFNGAAKDPFGNERVGFEGRAEILRSDWGLTWNAALETGGVLVSDRIKLNFDISAIRKA